MSKENFPINNSDSTDKEVKNCSEATGRIVAAIEHSIVRVDDPIEKKKEAVKNEIRCEEVAYVDKWMHEQTDGYDMRLEEKINARVKELKENDPSESDDQLKSLARNKIQGEMLEEELNRRVDEKFESRWESLKQELGEE